MQDAPPLPNCRSPDGAARRLVAEATTDEATQRPYPLDRRLVFAVGDGDFAPCGPRGELPAATAELTKAFKRALDAEKRRGRPVLILSIDEFNTTKCCCACGAVTSPPTVLRWKMDSETGRMTVVQDGPSRRLRCCTSCIHTGKTRDRDVQGARNILWLAYALYYGTPRPEYLQRRRTQPED